MNQEKIGALIAACRKEKKLTQKELAEFLGVTDKSVSKWENGICLPDVSLYKSLCDKLGITLNEFFAGEKISNERFKEKADENLMNALENSVFTLKEKIEYYSKKWEREHFFELTVEMIVIVILIIYGCIKKYEFTFLFIILGFIIGIIENNRKMKYIEDRAYKNETNLTLKEFKSSIERLKRTKEIVSKFKNKKDAIDFLVKETNLKERECSETYDFLMNLDLDKMNKD